MSRKVMLGAVLLTGVLLAPVASPALGAAGARAVSAVVIAPGVVHETWALPGSSAQVHLARVDPGPSARLRVVQASDRVAGPRETTSAMCRRTRGCQVALNGDFFTAAGPVGGVVRDGRLLRSPRPGHGQLSLEPLRATTQGPTGWTGTVRSADGDLLRLDGVNVPLSQGGTVLYTADYGAATPPCSCTELILAEADGQLGQLGHSVAVTLDGRGTGATPLARGRAVLVGEGAARPRLLALADQPEGRLVVELAVAQPMRHSVGTHPVVLREGRRLPLDAADPMLTSSHPRSLVGWNASGTVWLVAFDGRRPGGSGPTAAQAVDFLLRLGVTDAVMLDGGGSTTLATPEGPLNVPSDGSERAVSNALVVVHTPVATAHATPDLVAEVKAPAAGPATDDLVAKVTGAPGTVSSPASASSPAAEAPARGDATPVRQQAAATTPVRAPAVFPDLGLDGSAVERMTSRPLPTQAPDADRAVLLAAALSALAGAAWSRVAWSALQGRSARRRHGCPGLDHTGDLPPEHRRWLSGM